MVDKNKLKIGSKVLLECDGIKVPVKIVDFERRYGRYDFFIEPIGGVGQKWVMQKNLSIEK